MGNVHPKCLSNKEQLFFEVAREMADSADEWLGKGLLTAEQFVTDGELRLPVNLHQVFEMRPCKRIARRPKDDEMSEASGHPATSSSARSGGTSSRPGGRGSVAFESVTGPFLLGFLWDGDVECRQFEVLLGDSPESAGTARSEEDARNVAVLLSSFAPGRANFVLTLRTELASVSFKRAYSPFRDQSFVDENVRRLLSPDDGSQVDLLLFASNYGNCVVEKAFCGGVVTLSFTKVDPSRGAAASAEESVEVSIGREAFLVSKSQRGGDSFRIGSDGKKSATLEQLEKQLKQWCKSCGGDASGKSRPSAPGRNAAQIVRLKLAPLSKVEGLTVPGALVRMDFRRAAQWERAKEDLSRAAKARRLAPLQEAVDQALACGLEDSSLQPLQETRRLLDGAVEALRQAKRQEDVDSLEKALRRSEEAGLPEWDRSEVESAQELRSNLRERRQRSRLQAASGAAEVRLDDLVSILCDAFEEGFSHLEEFSEVEGKLTETTAGLTKRAKSDRLEEDQGDDFVEVLKQLPEAPVLSRANLAASRFGEAVAEMKRRAQERREQQQRNTELEGSLRELVSRAESAGGADEHQTAYHELHQTLRQVDGLVEGGAPGAPGGEALEALRRKAGAVLQEKKTMDETAQQAEARLREATLATTSTPEMLESALQDVAVKQQSGALHRSSLSASLLDSARRQLLALLRPELEEHMRKVRAPGAAESASGAEALASARHVLQRMEAACQPTCAEECREAARRCEEAESELQEGQRQHRSRAEAKEKLRHCHGSGDPVCLEAALNEARSIGVPDAHTLEAEARLRELRTAERQVQKALEAGDRVHLSAALEEAARQGLKTPVVDEAQQKLQSSKTSGLVSAIRQRDYHGLRQAIAEAECRSPDEVAELRDVISQAKEVHETLDSVAKGVSASLSNLNYDDLQRTVGEARRHNVQTDNVKKAEGVLATMDDALQKLRAATDRQPRDLGALQESLHSARQLGLQAHPVYRQCEEVFAGTCMPPGFSWCLEEQRAMWVVLSLRRPLQGEATAGGDAASAEVTHPFAAAAAELCHGAQISPEAEPYSVQYIHYALARIAQVGVPGKGGSATVTLADLQAALRSSLEDFSQNPGDGLPRAAGDGALEAPIDARQFNHIGVATKQAGLEATAHLLWWLVCIVEWQTGHRLYLAFMSEQLRRTADLQNEAESTSRSLRTHMMALQAKGSGAPEDDLRFAAPGGAAPEVAPENRHGGSFSPSRAMPSAIPPAIPEAIRATSAGGPSATSAASDARVAAVRGVLEEIEQVKRETEKLQAGLVKSKASSPDSLQVDTQGVPDLSRILELLRQAGPRNLEEARAAVQLRQREASGRAREIYGDTYGTLEARLLQLQYKGRQALDGEVPATGGVLSGSSARTPQGAAQAQQPSIAETQLPLVTYSSRPETAGSLQDHAFLQLLGIPEGGARASQSVDRCFQRVEIYDRFSESTGAVEDEFEKLCRAAVTEARQRCGGRRLVAFLKPLLVDLVKRRQRISSMLNTLRNCGLDKVEKNLLRKHLQARDVLIALAFSSMAPGPSQARMMSLAAKTDSPLPFLFGWALPAAATVPSAGSSGASAGDLRTSGGGLQLCSQIHWGALRELFCSPAHPLVLSLGSSTTLGKSYLLMYLYALQECHFRGAAQPPLRIHSMPSIDLIGDFAREESLRGVTLADVHCYDPDEELCEALTATLSSFSALILLHVSLKTDFDGQTDADSPDDDSDNGGDQLPQPTPELARLLQSLATSMGCPSVMLLLRDADSDEHGPAEQRRVAACVDVVQKALKAGRPRADGPEVLVWLVPPLGSLGPTELANEVKSLRKSRAMPPAGVGPLPPTLEGALGSAAGSQRKFPPLTVLQQRYDDFFRQLSEARASSSAQASLLQRSGSQKYGALAQRVFAELGAMGSSSEGLLVKLFPVAHCHTQLAELSQEKVRCLSRGREYLEPEERGKLESRTDTLDKDIARLRWERQRAPPHALLKTFAQLVLTGDINLIVEFGACLDDWKQSKRAPLLEAKLRFRKELDKLLEVTPEVPAGNSGGSKPASAAGAPGGDLTGALQRVGELRAELGSLQRRLDEVDVSTDSFWLELMLWHELERIGARRGLREVEERLSFASCKACYLNWVKSGNPIHFLHSAPLQFGAFEPLRWHPQLSGASFFGSDFIGDILRELDRDLGVDVRRRPLLVISVIGVQSSGKSTLMNYLFGCSFATHVGRCTKGLYISLLETQKELIVILDTEGLLSVEARDDVFDKQVALMTMACSDLVIVNNRGELGRHVGDLFQVCLFALYHLKLARISPAIGFVLQCLSMVNQQQQYEWVATVKKSLEESVQELQQKEKPQSFQLGDLVFLDSESIFVMPSAFNDDVQFGLQVSRATNLYALKALQLREKVFHWISRAKASQRQRWREGHGGPAASEAAMGATEAGSNASFASLSQWYDHARTVWQTLSMCGTDLLQFRTMQQVLMAQQLQEFCDALVQKNVDGKLSSESEALIVRCTRELRGVTDSKDIHAIDNAFRGQLDGLRDAVLQEMHHEFDEFVKSHDRKFTDEQVKSDKRYSLVGPMRRKYASVDSLWRSAVHLALEQRSMDNLFEEISAKVNDLLLEQGANVNVQNVERVFEEKWSQVMAEQVRKMRPNLDKVMQEVVSHFNAALLNLKSQFRKAHIFHGVKSLTSHEVRDVSDACSSFLLSKKGVGAALVGAMPEVKNAPTQVDNLWIKLVDVMRLEVDQQGQMSDAAALKILNRLNSEMESADQLRQLMHRLGSAFVQRLFCEMAKATIHYRFQIEQQNFQSRVNEVLGKKQQKLWEIQARVDSGKREVHCAKVWAKTFVDTLDQHFRNAVGRMAQEVVSHMSNILTNPGNACELAIERSFTKRNWRHVVMYAIDPTQYLFMEFHKEWEQFKQGLVDQYCRELKSNFGSCLRIAEERMQALMLDGGLDGVSDLTMNKLSKVIQECCAELVDESLSVVLCSCLPSFPSEADWPLNDLGQFVQFASVELRRYRANMRQTEMSVERRMEAELTRQKAECWKCVCGCPARCPGCGTKCNLESENHWPERPHECRRHLYPAFNGWQKQDGRKPFLLHCRAKAQWAIARTRPPIEPGAPERYWDNFQAMLEDEHPDWLDPVTRLPLSSMEPLEEYDEDCPTAPEDISKEIEENRRAWANCKDALLEHFTSMADDHDLEWIERFKREGGALSPEDFASVRDELFGVTPLESLEAMEICKPCDDVLDETSY